MSAQIADVSGGVITFKVSGKLAKNELAIVQKAAAEVIQRSGKVRFLVLVEAFDGIDSAGNWADVSFQADYDPFIEKIAIVGDKKWEDVALLFTAKGVRRVPIEYFQPADLAKATTWLAA